MSDAHRSLVDACVTYLRLNGIAAYAVNQVPQRLKSGRWTSLGAPEGLPDIIACVPPGGHLLAIECKSGSGVVRAAQRSVIAELVRHGATVVVAYAVSDLEHIVRGFRQLERAMQ